jgi:hypothetical protein
MKKNVLFIVIALTVLAGCKKEEPDPIAILHISDTQVVTGENITATNESIDSYSCLWSNGDGEIHTGDVFVFYYDEPGIYTVSLTAYSESGNKQDIATERVTVEPATGNITFWQSGTPSYGITTVTIGGQTSQITSDYPNGVSECNMSGCANFTLLEGAYDFAASDGTHNWSGTVTIIGNNCVRMQLQ